MPAITTTHAAGTQLSPLLQDVLNTQSNEWNYFFYPHRIKGVFKDLTNYIQTQNIFTSDKAINSFLDFLKAYLKENFNADKSTTIDENNLQALDKIIEILQEKIIDYTSNLDEFQPDIISHYLSFLHQLMEPQHIFLFDKPQIKLTSKNLQAIAGMLEKNSRFLTGKIIQQYISLLKISFDVPKLLARYDAGLDIIPLAEACFLNNTIDRHVVATQFFNLLGYQGQLLNYYKDNPKFTIDRLLLIRSTGDLESKAIELQQYFFNNLASQTDIDKALLQHYLYMHFFKVIYKEHPSKLTALKGNSYLSNYIKLDYVALPNRLNCRKYLSADNEVIFEYKNLGIAPEAACKALVCSENSFERWQKSLGFKSQPSHYTFRVGDSYEKYSFTYAYGHAPQAGGFYLSGKVENNIVNGEAYSYFNDRHQFIEVTRHEAVHHDNYKLHLAAEKLNNAITSLTNRNFNEGLAVLFAGGACAPGYSSHDFNNTAAPSLDTLLKNEYVGYSKSWLYNNFFIQQYSEKAEHFFYDLLHLDRTDFKKKWTAILKRDERIFFNWLPVLKQICLTAPKELTLDNCPSIYLKDYLPVAELNKFPITTPDRLSTRSVIHTSTKKPFMTKPDQPHTTTQSVKPDFYEDYFSLMYAINEKNVNKIEKTLTDTVYSARDIVNYQNPERGLETPLHFALGITRSNCSELMIKTLSNFGALSNLLDDRNQTAYMLADDCDNSKKIKIIFDQQIKNLENSKNNETGLVPYQQRPIAISIAIPISALINGSLAGVWKELAQRNKQHYSYLPSIIFYALQPATSALTTATMNSLVLGNAESLGLDNLGLSFIFYFGVNCLSLIPMQLGEKAIKKIQNKFLNWLVRFALYFALLNPSLSITLLTEGLTAMSFESVMMPLLSTLSNGLFFILGEFVSQKLIKQCFPINTTTESGTSNQSYFIRYSLSGKPKKTSVDQQNLQKFKLKFDQLVIQMKKNIQKQAYDVAFNDEIKLIVEDISEILNKISEDEGYLHSDDYGQRFKDIESNLTKIQTKLLKLEGKILYDKISEILTIFRGIRPLEYTMSDPLEKMHGGLQLEESKIPLIRFSFLDESKSTTYKKQQQSSVTKSLGTNRSVFFAPPSIEQDLPSPPTQEELDKSMIDQSQMPCISYTV